MRPVQPRGFELGPERDYEQDARGLDSRDRQIDRLQGRRVDPVRVLEDHEDWLAGCETDHLIGQGCKRPLLLPLRGDPKGRIPVPRWDRQERSEEGANCSDLGHRPPDHYLQLVEFRFRRLLTLEPGRPLQMLDDRVERAIRMVGRALEPDAVVFLRHYPLTQ